MAVEVVEGDITQQPVEGILVLLSSGGVRMGGVMRALRDRLGQEVWDEALRLQGTPEGTFRLVPVFRPDSPLRALVVGVDNLEGSLYPLVLQGLRLAGQGGLRSVALPALRLGQLRQVAGTPRDKCRDLVLAARQALREETSLRRIEIVCQGDSESAREMREALSQPFPTRRFVDSLGCEVAAFSGDGRLLALPDPFGKIAIWDLGLGRLLREISIDPWNDSFRVDVVALDETGQRLLVGLRFGSAGLYDVGSGQRIWLLPPPEDLKGWRRTKAVAFSPNGLRVAVGYGRWVGVWNTADGELLNSLRLPLDDLPDQSNGYDATPCAIQFSPDSRHLQLACGDLTFCRCDLEQNRVWAGTTASRQVVGMGLVGEKMLWVTSDGYLWPAGTKVVPTTGVDFAPDGQAVWSVEDRWELRDAAGSFLREMARQPFGYHPSWGWLEMEPEVNHRLRAVWAGSCCHRFSQPVKFREVHLRGDFLVASCEVFRLGEPRPLWTAEAGTLLSVAGKFLFQWSDGKCQVFDWETSQEVACRVGLTKVSGIWARQGGERVLLWGADGLSCFDRELNPLWRVDQDPKFYPLVFFEDGGVLFFAAPMGWPYKRFRYLSPAGEWGKSWHYTSYRSFDCQGNRLLFGRDNNIVEVWDAPTGRRLWHGQEGGERTYELSPSEEPSLRAVLAPGGLDVTPMVHGGRRAYEFQQSSPGARTIVVQSEEGAAVLGPEGQLLHRLSLPSEPVCAHFGRNHITLLIGTGELVDATPP